MGQVVQKSDDSIDKYLTSTTSEENFDFLDDLVNDKEILKDVDEYEKDLQVDLLERITTCDGENNVNDLSSKEYEDSSLAQEKVEESLMPQEDEEFILDLFASHNDLC